MLLPISALSELSLPSRILASSDSQRENQFMLKRLLASALLVSSVAHDIAAQTRAANDVQDDSVEAFLRAEMQHRGIPGMQVAVVRHGRIVLLGAYGMANVETGNGSPTTLCSLCTPRQSRSRAWR